MLGFKSGVISPCCEQLCAELVVESEGLICLGIQLYVLREHHVLSLAVTTCSSQIIICAVAWYEI